MTYNSAAKTTTLPIIQITLTIKTSGHFSMMQVSLQALTGRHILSKTWNEAKSQSYSTKDTFHMWQEEMKQSHNHIAQKTHSMWCSSYAEKSAVVQKSTVPKTNKRTFSNDIFKCNLFNKSACTLIFRQNDSRFASDIWKCKLFY